MITATEQEYWNRMLGTPELIILQWQLDLEMGTQGATWFVDFSLN